MRIVGIRRSAGPVEVAALSEDGQTVSVLAGLEQFWTTPAQHLASKTFRETLPAVAVEFVPPVLPGARVICIGLNYLKHVAEAPSRTRNFPNTRPYLRAGRSPSAWTELLCRYRPGKLVWTGRAR